MFIPITILEGKTQKQKEFIPLLYLDLPVELISKDGTYYLLWIRDDEKGEWWFITKLNNPADALAYVEGKISALDMLKNRGTTKIVFRSDSDYLTIKWNEGMGLEDAQQKLNIILPTCDSYLELWDVEKSKILSILQSNIRHFARERFTDNTYKHIINPEVYLLITYKPNITISFSVGKSSEKKPTSFIRQPSCSHKLYLRKPLTDKANKVSQDSEHERTTISA